MDPLKILSKIGGAFREKSVESSYPALEGGFDVFRSFVFDLGGMSQTRALETYGKSLYVFACVKKIAQKTASINFELYRIRNQDGDKEEVFVHEALDILYRPNPFQTKTEFYEKYMINKLLAGETFVLKVRSNGPGSEVVEMWNLRPDRMTVIIDKNDPKLIKGYKFSKMDGEVVFDADDVIHDAYPSPLDEFGGISALRAARVRVDTEEFANNYQANFFKNNARPDFILETPGKVSGDQKEEIREAWNKRHQGAKNTGKGAILEGGLKYQQVSISQREMDYIESMKFTRDDVLVAFQVPKPIVAITDDVNLANAKTAMEIFLKETIEPEINRLCEKLNEHFVYPEFGEVFFIDYSRDFLPTDEKMQAEIDEIEIRAGMKLINEAREERGREAVDGGWNLYQPLSNVPVGGLPQKSVGGSRVRDTRKGVFRGRGKAFRMIGISNQVEKTIYEELAKDKKIKVVLKDDEAEETEVAEPKVTKYIKPEIREKYVDVVLKAIDAKGDRFKPEIEKYADGQMQRVMRSLAERYEAVGPEMRQKAVDGAFDVKQENALLAEISFPFIEEFLRSAGEEALLAVAPEKTFEISDALMKQIKERAKVMAKEVNATTVEKLSTTLAEGVAASETIQQLTDRVQEVYKEYPAYRSEMIARTEATAANNAGFIEGYKQSGVANAKEWISTGDDRTRDSHRSLDGKVVAIDKKFSNGLMYPGDASGPASEVINCRCVLAPAFLE
jgi:HK97 family phage portal protein